jgi:hypothetical protein
MNAPLKLALAFAASALFAQASLAQSAQAMQQSSGGLVFHYGLVPAQVVLAHPKGHVEREMHGGTPRRDSHIVLALFDANDQSRLAQADVTVRITLLGGPSVTKRLELMTIAGQPSFGGFVPIAAPGIYRIRFDVRRPGSTGVTSAEFEHRVLPEPRR